MSVLRGYVWGRVLCSFDCTTTGVIFHSVLFTLFIGFLSLRLPYVFGAVGFFLFIFCFVFFLFVSLYLGRLAGPGEFFSSFVAEGTPLAMAPFVCLAETLSYYVRPFVLMLRPFANLSLGAFLGVAVSSLMFGSLWALLGLVLLFFYEIFVTVVHWFIVCSILSFSEAH